MRFQNILVQTTPRSDNDGAIAAATAIAKRHDATVTLIDVKPDLSWPLQFLTTGWEETLEDISGSKERLLEAQAAALTAKGICASHFLADGRLSVAIVRRVIAANHDLVVKVSEPPGTNRSGFLGSTDLRLLRKCPCPLLILKHDDAPGFQRVAVALDVMDDHEIQQQLDERVAQAGLAMCQGELHLLYAMRAIDEAIQVEPADADLFTPEQLHRWESELAQAADEKLKAVKSKLELPRCECHVLPASPEDAIPEFVNTHAIDLIAMGTLARSGLDGLLIGNTADRILNNVSCSILALKPATFVSPLADSASSDPHSQHAAD